MSTCFTSGNSGCACSRDTCEGCPTYEMHNKPKLTNADRIRAMSDEELATAFDAYICGKITSCPYRKETYKGNCTECKLQWLRQEAAEPPAETPAPICQTCGNFETCPWQDDPNMAEYRQTTEGRVVGCSDYKPE